MVEIVEVASGRVITNADYANDLISLTKGLMFKETGSLLMDFGKECTPAVWTLFMKFPIDILFIDSKKRIVDMQLNAEPISFNPRTWRIYRPKSACRFVLELEGGVAGKLELKEGDKLSFRF